MIIIKYDKDSCKLTLGLNLNVKCWYVELAVNDISDVEKSYEVLDRELSNFIVYFCK